MALAESYQTTVTVTTSAAAWTAPTTGYVRDLVITAGTKDIYVAFGQATSAVTTSSFQIPAGQSLVLMGAVPTTTAIVYTCIATSGGTSSASIGYASNVSVI